MKKLVLIILFILITSITVLAQDSVLLKSGISILDNVPKQFFGSWQVNSYLDKTDNRRLFNPKMIDVWNFLKVRNVLVLSNSKTGAKAEVQLEKVENNEIEFIHVTTESNKRITDIIKIELNETSFVGTDELRVEFLSDVDNRTIRTNYAIYKIEGNKIQ